MGISCSCFPGGRKRMRNYLSHAKKVTYLQYGWNGDRWECAACTASWDVRVVSEEEIQNGTVEESCLQVANHRGGEIREWEMTQQGMRPDCGVCWQEIQ